MTRRSSSLTGPSAGPMENSAAMLSPIQACTPLRSLLILKSGSVGGQVAFEIIMLTVDTGKDVFVVSSIFTAKQFVEKLNDVLKEKGDTRYVEYVTIPEEKFNLFRQYSEELWTKYAGFHCFHMNLLTYPLM